ncbi:MAG TPA: DUF6499 domain-containing protein [Saprospiraceae bacterium]|uniref:transcriptional regulator domain-containing protein n=1 Tax=Noviherbaspirillum sp. TaxID=1926288 RepID=UPI002B466E68|nr:DUF6499 domain-containing protein [Noviherbaspirillum sp.]HJV81345.1 DUF6499 domain-containing protein [Noviherbaspirillum sp.]HJW30039.1 DUF6499 domain-containing protein [Saprospiraceae bacterium]
MAYEKKFGRAGSNDLTPKEWAWEFLRRNPVYKDAFSKLHGLSATKRKAIEAVRKEGFAAANRVKDFPFDWFEFDGVTGPTHRDKSMEEWLLRVERYMALNENPQEPFLSLGKQFYPSTFALADWIDPSLTPLPKDKANIFGVIALESVAWLNEKAIVADDAELKDYERGVHWLWRRSERHRSKSISETAQGVRGMHGAMFELLPQQAGLSLSASTDVVFRISLDFPIRPQLDEVTRIITAYQAKLENEGLCYSFPKRVDKAGIYSEYIQILDLLADGKEPVEIAKCLRAVKKTRSTRLINQRATIQETALDLNGEEITPSTSSTQEIRKKIQRALELRDVGFLGLAFMVPEKS